MGGMFGGGAGGGQAMADGRPAHERYADQLEQLQAMGYVFFSPRLSFSS
jgi:hypothetical protein